MTEEEWQKLYENFETTWLLDAVDHLDELRAYLGDGSPLEAPEIRTDLLKLHSLAMEVVNNGSQSRLQEMIDLAFDLEDQTSDMMAALEKIQEVIQQLINLLPEAAEFDDDDEIDREDEFDDEDEDDFFD